ncbi:guanitoxin biosynthesis heme-dependent pre-guanitoxin N-hydroxylase GntA [Nocardia lijiangensis]|uniref:guanitoxin biosynthesis heme-dependent pre-guanitoxin N-hydroxylase GntA n=1 Tax=Nocardia lijiangensis TaxID=299618 RepID=UPI003D743C2B
MRATADTERAAARAGQRAARDGHRPLGETVELAFRRTVLRGDFPCLGARSVVRRGRYRLGVHGDLGAWATARAACADLYAFAAAVDDFGFASYLLVCAGPSATSEARFERLLWTQLQRMHEFDARFYPWDPEVGDDPRDPRFAFSIGARAYHVIGLHPLASRAARRFPWPAVVFNPHAQFARLADSGALASFQRMIRARDIALQGSVNPMLLGVVAGSEACQYSGRAVTAQWHCPFHPARMRR